MKFIRAILMLIIAPLAIAFSIPLFSNSGHYNSISIIFSAVFIFIVLVLGPFWPTNERMKKIDQLANRFRFSNLIFREQCPSCKLMFPAQGPKLVSILNEKDKFHIFCQFCNTQLAKTLYRDEATAMLIGALLIGVVSFMSLFWHEEFILIRRLLLGVAMFSYIVYLYIAIKRKHYIAAKNA